MGKGFGIQVILRILLMVLLGVSAFLLFSKSYFFSGIFCLIIAIILLFEFYYFLIKPITDIHKTISALIHHDFSLQSPQRKKSPVFSDLEKLYQKHKQDFFEQESVQIIYNNLLNSITTGILILKKTENEDWEIFLMNHSFAGIFQIPVYASWSNFKRNVPEFIERLNQIEFGEVQQTLEISVDNRENQTFSLKTSAIKTYNYSYYIISLDSVQSIIEKKEKQAWHDLMKVISHEMMNTLTPINSLINSLTYFSEQDNLNEEDKTDFKESLKTIQRKTIHMLEFVDNYRQLTNLPQPKKSYSNIILLIQSCLDIMKPLLDESKIKTNLQIDKSEIFCFYDPILTERVIINLLTNSIYAVQNQVENPKITISVYHQNPRTIVEIRDNGIGIDKSIRDKVFIPFFTTRTKGAGIGLSLSRNIMEAQNGNLTFKSKPGDTVFFVSFYPLYS